MYLSRHQDAHGLLAPRARPAIASKLVKCADRANKALERTLTEALRGDHAAPRQEEGPAGTNAVDAAVFSLDELAVTTAFRLVLAFPPKTHCIPPCVPFMYR